MEIINCVTMAPQRRKISLPVFERKTRTNYTSSVFSYSPYSVQSKSFSIPKVKKQITVKQTFMDIGHCVSIVQNFTKKNYKKFLIAVAIIAAAGAVAFGAIKISSYAVNNTGALKLQTAQESDLETLNKLMAAFAMEGVSEYDESGKIIDSVVKIDAAKYIQPVTYEIYKVKSGDTISGIARKFGLTNISSLISVNDIGNVRQLAAGQKLKIPSIDGIVYTVQKGDSIESICKAKGVKVNTLLDVNELTSDQLSVGQSLFLPGASLDSKTLKTAMGDKFIVPIQAKFRWTSPFGERVDPIANVKSFHTGTDMACPTGTPILAAMSGKVSATGTNRVYGNFVIIDHGNGYQTLYAHMSKIIAQKGQWVSQGTRIGLVGNTGYSTGPHLHFTVYKNGKLVNPMSVLK